MGRSGPPLNQLTMKLTRILTRHSVILPSSSVSTLMSLTQAPRMFLTLLAAFFKPCCTASSMPLFEAEEISITFDTVPDMAALLLRLGLLADRLYAGIGEQ